MIVFFGKNILKKKCNEQYLFSHIFFDIRLRSGLGIDTQKVKNKSIFDKFQKTKEKVDFDDTLKR